MAALVPRDDLLDAVTLGITRGRGLWFPLQTASAELINVTRSVGAPIDMAGSNACWWTSPDMMRERDTGAIPLVGRDWPIPGRTRPLTVQVDRAWNERARSPRPRFPATLTVGSNRSPDTPAGPWTGPSA